MTTFVKLSRDIFNSPHFDGDKFSRRDAFLWLVSKAEWRAQTKRVNGVLIGLERGQVAVSRSRMADAWGWSQDAVRHFLGCMEREGCFKLSTPKEAPRSATVITICNYDRYQSSDMGANEDQPPSNPQGTPKEHPTRTQRAPKERSQPIETATKNLSEEREEREEGEEKGITPECSLRSHSAPTGAVAAASPSVDLFGSTAEPDRAPRAKPRRDLTAEQEVAFAEFWDVYPRRVAKQDARRAFVAAVAKADLAEILAGARRYLSTCAGRPLDKVAHPATWLNGGRWADELPGRAAIVQAHHTPTDRNLPATGNVVVPGDDRFLPDKGVRWGVDYTHDGRCKDVAYDATGLPVWQRFRAPAPRHREFA